MGLVLLNAALKRHRQRRPWQPCSGSYYLESSLVIRAIRVFFSPDIGEIVIDTDDIADQATAFMSVVMPDNVQRVKRCHDDTPLLSRFQIESRLPAHGSASLGRLGRHWPCRSAGSR